MATYLLPCWSTQDKEILDRAWDSTGWGCLGLKRCLPCARHANAPSQMGSHNVPHVSLHLQTPNSIGYKCTTEKPKKYNRFHAL